MGSVALWMLLVGGIAHLARAQELLTLDAAVKEAILHHPRVEAETERVAAANGMVQQAGLRPNPRLYIQSENWNVGSPIQPVASTFTDQFFYASQVLETGGKRQRRIELAQENTVAAQLDRELVTRQIAARVKMAYWAATGAQRVVDLLRDSQETFRQAITYHEIQLREGAIAEADVIRVRLEGDRVAVAVENAAREAESAQISLLREMGRGRFDKVRLVEALDRQPKPVVVNVEEAVAARPEVRLAHQAVAKAQAALRLQQAMARPDVEVLSGYKRTVGFNTFMWGVQVNLPFFNKNQGNISAASSEVRVAEAELAAVQAQVRADVELAYRDVQNRRDRLAALMAGSLQRSEESVSIARAAYREGGTDLLRLLDAERLHIEFEVQSARLRAEYQQSLVLLATALGVEP